MSSVTEDTDMLNESIIEFTPLIASKSISPITQEPDSVNEISTDLQEEDDGLACLDKIRALLESAKGARTKLELIRDIVNSTSGGKQKSRKYHKKGGKRSRKHRK